MFKYDVAHQTTGLTNYTSLKIFMVWSSITELRVSKSKKKKKENSENKPFLFNLSQLTISWIFGQRCILTILVHWSVKSQVHLILKLK